MLTELQKQLTETISVEVLNLTRPQDYVAGSLSLANVRRTLADIWSILRRSPDAKVVDIHTAFVPAVTAIRAGLLAAAARLRGARVIMHIHGGDLPRWSSTRSRRALLRICLAPVDRSVAVSSEVLSVLPRRRAILIPNGVDTDRFHPPGRDRQPARPVIIYLGLLTDRKGVIDLLDASALMHERGVEHELVLVGGRPDEGDEAERSVRQAARGTEKFLGAVPHDQIPELLRRADIFCLPSWYEAMPLSILEAMATELPVVATEVGQIPTMVDERTGILVPPRDPRALAAALEQLVVNGETRRRLGSFARERAINDFSIREATHRLLVLVESLADSPPIGR